MIILIIVASCLLLLWYAYHSANMYHKAEMEKAETRAWTLEEIEDALQNLVEKGILEEKVEREGQDANE